MSEIHVLDAPSNLGLRPPEEGSVPGCYKAPGALRNRGLLPRLGARDAGTVVPPRYRAQWWPGYGVRNVDAIARYSLDLATRVGSIMDEGGFPLVLGGDCSILVGIALALAQRGRYGLVFIDGHTDFRHLGNAEAVGAAAGEDLAIVTGRGGRLSCLLGHDRYVSDEDTVVLGVRREDENLDELRLLGINVQVAADIRGACGETAVGVIDQMDQAGVQGFWIHLDVDVLDPDVMPAVDSPDADGLQWDDLVALLGPLIAAPLSVGMEVTVFDPDLDSGGSLAARLADHLVDSFAVSVDGSSAPTAAG
jgi:arginase